MAPEGSGTTRTLALGGNRVRITNVHRVMYPDTGLTKGGVIDYYRAVAEAVLPQLRDRPVTQIRYPQGIGGDRFFQKNVSRSTPGWIRRFAISASPGSRKPAKQVTYPVIDDEAALVWFANQAALALNTPQWHAGPRGGVGKPDRLVIDLDPGEGSGLDACAEVARLARARLSGAAWTPTLSRAVARVCICTPRSMAVVPPWPSMGMSARSRASSRIGTRTGSSPFMTGSDAWGRS
jgi:DNA primase